MIWEIEFLGRNYYITNKVRPLIDMKTKIFTTIPLRHSRADGYIVGLPNLLLCGQQIRRRQHLSILADARRHRHPGIHHCKYEEMTLLFVSCLRRTRRFCAVNLRM